MSKTAIVTGASEGIGRAFARALAKEGYRLTVVARSAGKLADLVKELGDGHRALVADLSQQGDIARVAEDVKVTGYDLLVNNAGVGVYGRFGDKPLEATEAMMRLNVDALVALSHAFLARAKKGDALVNVASTLGLLAFPNASTYAATKAFVVSFSEGLWYEQKDRGVYVTALCPGVTRTSFHAAAGGTDTNKPPDALSQTPEAVALAGLAALRKRALPVVVSGGVNKLMLLFMRFVSRKGMTGVMGGFSPKNEGPPRLIAPRGEVGSK